jgi:hypothetical protein
VALGEAVWCSDADGLGVLVTSSTLDGTGTGTLCARLWLPSSPSAAGTSAPAAASAQMKRFIGSSPPG